MDQQITAVLVGAGNRGNIYASVSLRYPEKLKIVGIVDPDAARVKLLREKFGVPGENCFDSVVEFVQREKFADAVINGTMDHLHVETSVPILERGYDLLLEKPLAVNEEEMGRLLDTARQYDSKVVICHVLRYSDFYRAVKEHLLRSEIGNIISIEMCEHANYHHTAAAYVRGKWRSEKVCFAPMLLAKSCHDVDMMLWLMQGTRPVSVSSFGSEFQFGADNKPEGAGSRCLADCPMVDECVFSAKSNYVTAARWAPHVWAGVGDPKELTTEQKMASLTTDNPYGKCVWDCERDGNVDHQVVTVQFANGATGSFHMVGGSAKQERNLHIVGTKGEIKGTFEDRRYLVRTIAPLSPSGYEETVYDLQEHNSGHGGGDEGLVLDFIDYLNGQDSISCATLEDSMMSHLLIFKAEEARKNNTVVRI